VRIVGVDGGQCATRCLVVDEKGCVIGHGRGGPSNHVQGEAGRRRLHAALESSIRQALPGDETITVDSIVLGMTGIGKSPEQQALVTKYVREFVRPRHIGVHNDLVIVLAGASVGRPGIMVYAGTGAHTYGVNDRGEEVRVGGWGHIIDDEGGGYQIGCQALKWTYRAEDGRGRATALKSKLLEHFGCETLAEVRDRVYESGGLGRPEIAALAKLVAHAAGEGDTVAVSILENVGRTLAATAVVALRKLGKADSPFDIYYGGGVFAAGELVLRSFKEELASHAPAAVVRSPAFPPVGGAVLLGFQLVGVEPGASVLDTLEREVARIGWAE